MSNSLEATADRREIKVCLECPLDGCATGGGKELDLSTISRVEVARAVHCVRQHIQQVFLGKAICSMPLAYDISKHLGVTLDEFYKAITGANGQNPSRKYRPTSSFYDPDPFPPKYTVDGRGYPNLRLALKAIGNTFYRNPRWEYLSPEVQARITRNRVGRGK